MKSRKRSMWTINNLIIMITIMRMTGKIQKNKKKKRRRLVGLRMKKV